MLYASPEDVSLSFNKKDLNSRNRQRSDDKWHSTCIRCFKHCTHFVFCFEIPDFCPVCKADLIESSMVVPPFLAPSPFEFELSKFPAILVKPSRGKSFFTDYNDQDGLHCGILDECGIVHDFDENGLHSSDMWLKSVHIPIKFSVSDKLPISILLSQAKEDWMKINPKYDPQNSNCFSFVLWVLQRMGFYCQYSAKEFIDRVILPKTTEAAKYITVYRRLSDNNGVYVATDQ